jgi:hypothetical protein
MRRLLLSALVLAACSGDATGPDACGLPKACAVGGADLAVVRVAAADAEATWRGTTANAEGFDVEVEVLNRGNRRAGAGLVEVEAWTASGSVELPSLGPGERVQVRVPLRYTRTYLVHGQDPAAITPVARVLHDGDAYAANDSLRGDEFITDLPVFDVATVPWGEQARRLGQAVSMAAYVGRRTATEPQAATVDVLFCVLDGNRGCTADSWGPLVTFQSIGRFGITYLPATPALAQGRAPAAPGNYRLAVCVVPARTDATQARLDPGNPDHRCIDAGPLRILP